MMAFAKRVISSLLVSSDASTISLIMSDEPGALPFFMLFIAAIYLSICLILLPMKPAQKQYQRVVGYLLVK